MNYAAITSESDPRVVCMMKFYFFSSIDMQLGTVYTKKADSVMIQPLSFALLSKRSRLVVILPPTIVVWSVVIEVLGIFSMSYSTSTYSIVTTIMHIMYIMVSIASVLDTGIIALMSLMLRQPVETIRLHPD